MMKTEDQIKESIERFKLSFWEKKSGVRTPVGVVPQGIFTPICYLKKEMAKNELNPRDIADGSYLSDYEYAAAHKKFGCDDWFPFSAAWRGVPWIEAICGCPVRYSTGALVPGERTESLSELADASFPFEGGWAERLKELTAGIAANPIPDCFASPTILRGVTDIIAAMRSMTNFYMDLMDNRDAIKKISEKITDLYIQILDMHFSAVKPKYGGYGHIYGYWAPGKNNVIQEDVLGMCSPTLFREMFMENNARIVKHIGDYALFHLHSTGYGYYRDVTDIPGIAGLELTVEMNGPPLRYMLSDIRYILEKSRLILFVDHYFEDIPFILDKIPHEGLYILISDKFISEEKAFTDFIKNNFK
jgi:hypothetical protein